MFRRPLATVSIALALTWGAAACSGDAEVSAKVTTGKNDASTDTDGSTEESNGGSSVGTSGRGGAGNNASTSGSSSRGGTGGSNAQGGRGGSNAQSGNGGSNAQSGNGGSNAQSGNGGSNAGTDAGPSLSGMYPLEELANGDYMGFAGGLYPGSNEPPSAHRAAGITAAQAIEPLDMNGNPNPNGKIVLMSIGMSNTTREFCYRLAQPNCHADSFMALAAADGDVDTANLVLIDGAEDNQVASTWNAPTQANYNRVRDMRLTPAGVTEAQVQAIWLKVAQPVWPELPSLPANNASAYQVKADIGRILRAAKTRYPNLRMVFGSSRIYAGYANSDCQEAQCTLNPEPYAFENGFSVKWAIEAQITQMSGGAVDQQAGDLNYDNGTAPWYGWGPYMWADGTTPRASDGLIWERQDLREDGTHPTIGSGTRKVAMMLLDFLKNSPFSRCWFLGAHPACN